MTKLNFENKIKKMESLINIWAARNLSLKGKVTIIKAMVLSQISHLLTMCFCPKQVLDTIDKLIFNFLWNKKPHKIKRDTIIANFSDGGLRMPDIYALHTKSKISWLKRLYSDEEGKWKNLMWYMLNIDEYLINHKLPLTYSSKCFTHFHEQIIKCWHSAKCTLPKSAEEINKEYLFDNMFICSDGKTLQLSQFKLNKETNKDIQPKSLFTDNGGQESYGTLKQRLSWNISIFNYNLIYSAIPKTWKQKLMGHKPTQNVNSKVYLKINGILKNLTNVHNRDLYFELLRTKVSEPSSVDTWIDIFPFLESVSWKAIFKNTHQIVPDSYLQTFQYKVMHRLTNCNYNLFKWDLKKHPFCAYCNHTDTIEHHFYLCGYAKLFWELLSDHITVALHLEKKLNLTICEVIFGIEYTHKCTAIGRIINMIAVVGKWYINNCRTNEKKICFDEFVHIARNKIFLYKTIYSKAVRGVEKEIYEILENINL